MFYVKNTYNEQTLLLTADFIKTTDHRPTDHLPTDPPTTYHLPTDPPTTYPPTHRLAIINLH